MFSVAPLIAPTLGALILYVGAVAAIYVALAALGALLLALGFARFRESQPEGGARASTPATVFAGYRRALTNRFCAGLLAYPRSRLRRLFAYVNMSPLLFIQGYGVSKAGFAGLFAITRSGVIAGGEPINTSLVRRACETEERRSTLRCRSTRHRRARPARREPRRLDSFAASSPCSPF